MYYDESTVAPKEDNKKYTVSKHGWPVCVNGDSLSVVLQSASFPHLLHTSDLPMYIRTEVKSIHRYVLTTMLC